MSKRETQEICSASLQNSVQSPLHKTGASLAINIDANEEAKAVNDSMSQTEESTMNITLVDLESMGEDNHTSSAGRKGM